MEEFVKERKNFELENKHHGKRNNYTTLEIFIDKTNPRTF